MRSFQSSLLDIITRVSVSRQHCAQWIGLPMTQPNSAMSCWHERHISGPTYDGGCVERIRSVSGKALQVAVAEDSAGLTDARLFDCAPSALALHASQSRRDTRRCPRRRLLAAGGRSAPLHCSQPLECSGAASNDSSGDVDAQRPSAWLAPSYSHSTQLAADPEDRTSPGSCALIRVACLAGALEANSCSCTRRTLRTGRPSLMRYTGCAWTRARRAADDAITAGSATAAEAFAVVVILLLLLPLLKSEDDAAILATAKCQSAWLTRYLRRRC